MSEERCMEEEAEEEEKDADEAVAVAVCFCSRFDVTRPFGRTASRRTSNVE